MFRRRVVVGKEDYLRNHSEGGLPFPLVVAQVLAVDQYSAGRRRQQPGDDVDERGLPAAGRPTHADLFAWGDGQVDVLERDAAGAVVAEADVLS
jgi:hypothetical protein